MCRYQDIVCNGTRISLRHLGDSVELVVDITSPAIVYPHFVLNSELSIYLHMLRLLSGRPLAPEALRLAYPAPADTREHVRVFAPALVQFGTPYSALRMPTTVLALAHPEAEKEPLSSSTTSYWRRHVGTGSGSQCGRHWDNKLLNDVHFSAFLTPCAKSQSNFRNRSTSQPLAHNTFTTY